MYFWHWGAGYHIKQSNESYVYTVLVSLLTKTENLGQYKGRKECLFWSWLQRVLPKVTLAHHRVRKTEKWFTPQYKLSRGKGMWEGATTT